MGSPPADFESKKSPLNVMEIFKKSNEYLDFLLMY